MLILDTDWCPVEAMSLSKNAYFIYKRFIFNKVFGKHKAKTLELKFEDLKAFLNVKWKNNSGVQAIIKKALNGMVKNKLIAGYSSNKNFVNKRSYELYFEKDQKDLKK
jgi:ACT domain-containing protein